MKATIKSYAVTYEGMSIIEVSAPKHAYIRVHYKTMLSRQLSWSQQDTSQQENCFGDDQNFEKRKDVIQKQPHSQALPLLREVYFVEETKVSYLGEDVEIVKEVDWNDWLYNLVYYELTILSTHNRKV